MASMAETRAGSQQQDETHTQKPLPLIPTASISLSISSLTLLPSKNLAAAANPPPNEVKIPSQIASLAGFSLSLAKKASRKSAASANPLQNSLTVTPLRPSNPSSAAALRRASVVWFRNDLRIHDNECLTAANNESLSVLPVYCFDPRDYGKSSSGFNKTGPYRAKFVIESVSDLRRSLQARGSDLVVRIGKPETVLPELVKAVGADAVYVHREVSNDEVKAEEKIAAAMEDEGVEMKYCWGSTLYHLEDLPFDLEKMPTNYGGFKDSVKNLPVRKTIEALDRLKNLPKRGGIEPGEIPSLLDLGLNPNDQDGRTPAIANASTAGGETAAVQRLKAFALDCKAEPNNGVKGGANDTIFGANFSCKVSPWLALGCISPRFMFDELKKSSSTGGAGKSEPATSWFMSELLWRDFFRFITKKYSSAKQENPAPVTASMGACA
ncbi:blue-light photoreceptor PHR2-like [Andrographis paniculata]|uniref:blue-light photoreceptor PHR2-like n=1 Tax=Andrographis paniculata TaxID=175694 RepID=UPI0021E73546|nr:blue-light photoreceptor PHR2-like [Andrographis paniculata]